jgi:hypothetical protein
MNAHQLARRTDGTKTNYVPTHNLPELGKGSPTRYCANACKDWARPGAPGWRAVKRPGKSGQHICPKCVAAADARKAAKEAA